jgi:CubicO group peptidase (beta-lactamase class C family)
MHKLMYFCTALGASVAMANAAVCAEVDPARASAVDGIFAQWSKSNSPGCAVGVYRDGGIAFERGYGMANLELDVPITPDTVFDIGSTSKQFTAAAIVLLVRDGKLSLDDDIRKYVPEIPDYGKPITIRQMLHHASGLRDFVTLLMFADVDYDDVSTQAQALSMLARQKALNYLPGDQYLYSNSGFFLAGIIVERVSGQSLRKFAEQRIFAPLGMKQTRYKDDHAELVPHRASGYAPGPQGEYRLSQPNWEQVGDGGVLTNVRDLLLWDRNFAEPKVGDAAFVAEMQRTGTLNDGHATNYALGLMVDEHRGRTMIHHGGSWGGFRAEVIRFPEERLSVSTLCNESTIDASALAIKVADLWLAGGAVADEIAPDKDVNKVKRKASGKGVEARRLQAWVGAYRNPKSGGLRFVDMDGQALWIEAFGGRNELRALSGNKFELINGPFEAEFTFEPGERGRPSSLHQFAMGKESVFDAIMLDTPTPKAIQHYAGRYSCDELGVVYQLEAVDGVLQRREPRGVVERFRALERGEFNYGNLTLRFQGDAERGYDAIAMDIGRVRNLICPRIQ